MFSLEKERDRQALEHIGAFRKGLMCSICKNFLRNTYNLPCGHNFCQGCVDDALADRNICPDCKNPAWQKDTLKAAQADSAVHDWVTLCEPQYQAFIARQAAMDDTDETNSLCGEVSSKDGLEEEEEEEEKQRQSAATSAVRPVVLPKENHGRPGAVVDAKSRRLGHALRIAVSTHGAEAEGAPTAGVGASANSAAIDENPLEQDKENVAAPLWCTSSAISNAVEAPVSCSGRATRSPSGKKISQRVQPQQSSHPGRAQPSPGHGQQVRQDVPQENDVRAVFEKPGASSLTGNGAVAGTADIELTGGSGASPRPEAPSFRPGVDGSTVASPLVVPPIRSEPLARSEGPASEGRATSRFAGTLPDTCDVLAVESPPPFLTARRSGLIGTPPTFKAGGVDAKAGSVAQPAAVDIRHACAAANPTVGLAFDVSIGGGDLEQRTKADGRVLSAGVAECGGQDVNFSAPMQNYSEYSTSPTGQRVRDCLMGSLRQRRIQAGAGNGDNSGNVGATYVRVDCSRVGRESETGQVESGVGCSGVGGGGVDSSAGEKRIFPLSARSGKSDAADGKGYLTGSAGSASEDEVSDAESIPIFVGADGQQHEAEQTPTRGVASPPWRRASAGGVDRHERTDREGESTVAGSADVAEERGREEDEEDGEETCDETDLEDGFVAATPSHPAISLAPGSAKCSGREYLRDDTRLNYGLVEGGERRAEGDIGASRDSAAGQERLTASNSAEERERPGMGVEAMEPLKTEPLKTEAPAQLSLIGGVSGMSSSPVGGLVGGSNVEGVEERAGTDGASMDGIADDPETDATISLSTNAPCEDDALGCRGPGALEQKSSRDTSQGSGVRSIARSQSVVLGKDRGRSQPERPKKSLASLDQKNDDGVHSRGRNDTQNIWRRVPETLDPTCAPLDVSDTGDVQVSLGHDGEVEVAETPAQSTVELVAPETCVGESSEGGMESASPSSRVLVSRIVNGALKEQRGVRKGDSLKSKHEDDKARGGELDHKEAHPLVITATQEVPGAGGHHPRRQTSTDDLEGAPRLKVASSESRRLSDSYNGMPKTRPQKEVVRKVRNGDAAAGIAHSLCLTAQGRSERDGATHPVAEEGPRHSDREEGRQFSETDVQSLTAQEVPETANAWSSPGGGEDGVSQVDRVEEAVLTQNSCRQSEVFETPQLRVGATQSTEDETVGVRDEDNGTKERDMTTTPRGRTARSPDSAGRKRSAELATLSPDKLCSDPGSAGKRLRVRLPAEEDVCVTREALTDTDCSNRLGCHASHKVWPTEQGPPIMLRGGSGSDASDNECGSEVGHEYAAAQDAWQADGGDVYDTYDGYESASDDNGDGAHADGDGGEGSKPPPPPSNAGARPPRKNKLVANPYAPRAHLELQPDVDSPTGAAEPAGAEGVGAGTQAGLATGARGAARKSCAVLRRPSNDIMGFGAPSRDNISRGPSGLGIGSVDAMIRERDKRSSSNAILRAGRGDGYGEVESADKAGSWSMYSLGPDTQDVAALDAGFAAKRARRSLTSGVDTAASDADRSSAFSLVHDNGTGGGDRRSRPGDLERRSAGKKRPRARAAASTDAGDVGPATSRRGAKRKDRGGCGRPVIVLLGCEEWELERGKMLCESLGQHCLHTALVRDATHVVIGSRNTLERGSSGDGDVDEAEGQGARHELVKHGIEGYLEAVMLGLWVLDFSWVQACLKTGKGARNSPTGRRRDGNGVDALSPLTPPRDFELVGCRNNHEGCEPRRGRVARGVGMPGVFHGLAFSIVGAGGSEAERRRLERLLKLGEGVLMENATSKRSGVKGGWVNDPFAAHDGSASDNEEFADGRSGGASNASAVTGNVVVLAFSDRPDGGVSPKLAQNAIDKREEIEAKAAVDHAWILSSVENGSPADFDSHHLSGFLNLSQPSKAVRKEGRTRTIGASKRGASDEHSKRNWKSRLSLLPESSTQRQVVMDVDIERINRQPSPALAGAQSKESEKLMMDAQEIVNAADRVARQAATLAPVGLGSAGFEFTRLGKKKPAPGPAVEKPSGKGKVTSFANENKAQQDLKNALHKAGYLNLTNKALDHDEHKLGEFWFDKVYDGFLLKRSERVIPQAKERGCPLHVIREVYERHSVIQDDASANRLEKLLEEFSLWKATRRGGQGRAADDAVEVL